MRIYFALLSYLTEVMKNIVNLDLVIGWMLIKFAFENRVREITDLTSERFIFLFFIFLKSISASSEFTFFSCKVILHR